VRRSPTKSSAPLTRLASVVVVAALSVYCTPTETAEEAADSGVAIRQSLEQKRKLLEALTIDSPSAHRIDQSVNDQAIQKLGAARNALVEAKRLLDANRLEQAQQLLDDGLRWTTEASRLVIDTNKLNKRNLEQYQQLHQRIESFQLAFKKLVADKGPSVNEFLDQTGLRTLIDRAEKRVADQDYVKAIAELTMAANMIERALVEARRSETVVYSLSFDSPAEEYAYEQERNRSHQELIALLIQQRRPQLSTVRLINELLEQNSGLISMAQSLAGKGRYRKAIATIEEGTEQLIQALRLGGLNLTPTQ